MLTSLLPDHQPTASVCATSAQQHHHSASAGSPSSWTTSAGRCVCVCVHGDAWRTVGVRELEGSAGGEGVTGSGEGVRVCSELT